MWKFELLFFISWYTTVAYLCASLHYIFALVEYLYKRVHDALQQLSVTKNLLLSQRWTFGLHTKVWGSSPQHITLYKL